MVKPKDALQISYQDLVNRYTVGSYFIRCFICDVSSGQGETVINILTDLNGFWTYENRELVLAENQTTTENN